MMPQGFSELIKSSGYTRVIIRPKKIPEVLTIAEAKLIVEKSSVSLRGWDFPHISIRNDKHGGSESFAEFAQDWCDWHDHREFWRMYKSGQFLHYKSLREDLSNDDRIPKHGRVLGIGDLTYKVTEVTEFAFRLFRRGLYQNGSDIQLTIGHTRGRELWVDDPNRMPFTSPRITSSSSLMVERSLEPHELMTGDPKVPALSMLLEIFDAFGWNPSSDQLRRKQDELYALGFGRG